MTSAKFTDTDLGADALARWMREAGRKTVRVGVLSDSPKKDKDGEETGISLVEVAAVHEFGAPSANVPQRSFIRATADAQAGEIQRLEEVLGAQMIDGILTEDKALGLLGSKVAAMMQARITSNIPPPLKAETVDRKGSSVALVDTGQLKASITFAVESETA
jgi:phage gpG-like protein